MAKKKLLLIAGAGSSIAQGMPSVPALDRLMTQWSQEWSAVRRSPSDYFEALWTAIDQYYAAGTLGPPQQINFEKVLRDMAALSHWMMPPPLGDTLRQIACNNAPPPTLSFATPDRYGPTVAIDDQLISLLSRLAQHVRALSQRLDTTTAQFASYKAIVDRLRHAFDFGIYNLNYDNVAVSSWPGAFTGFGADGRFDPRAVHTRSEWGFIYHLHGSVHHTLVGPFADAMRWQDDLAGTFADGDPGRSTDTRSDGKSMPKASLIAGGFKLDQLLIEPFQSLYASLIRHVRQADAILIGGYGFGDEHINRTLRNRLEVPADRAPVMVLTRSPARTDSMQFRVQDDLWAWELTRALAAGGDFFREPDHPSPPLVGDLIARAGFEVSSDHRVAIWHSGFVEVAPHLDRVVSWLDGTATDAALAGRP